MDNREGENFAADVRVAEGELHFTADGGRHRFDLEDISEKLKSASEVERDLSTVSPSGYGGRWSLSDEDISFAGLFK